MAVLPSARNGQWYQYTYGAITDVYWQVQSSVHILDDGTVWVAVDGAIPQTSQDSAEGELTLINVRPEGSIRHTVDSWGFPAVNSTYSDSAPYGASGSITQDAFSWAWDNCELVSDGTNFWAYSFPQKAWYKIDVKAHTYQKVAGATGGRGSDTYLKDSHDGMQATFDTPGCSVIHGGYLYFSDQRQAFGGGNPSAESNLRTIRRMKLEAPYPVETIFGPMPAGMGTLDWDWVYQTNTSTGRLNAFNSDVIWCTDLTGLAVWEDYLYIMSGGHMGGFTSPNQGYYHTALRRMPLGGGPLELLYWSLADRNGVQYLAGQTPRAVDEYHYFSVNPVGVRTVGNNYDPFPPATGTPDLEGFGLEFDSKIAIMPDGSLIVQVAMFAHYMVKFDLPSLLAYVAANGPMRHNRVAPFYQMLHNGTRYEETAWWYSFVPNPYNRYNVTRQWEVRDGSLPLAGNNWGRGWDINSNHPDWAGKIVFTHWSGTDYLNPHAFTNGYYICLVSVLQPGNTSTVKVTLSFEGRVLKGYGNARGLQAPSAPSVITI